MRDRLFGMSLSRAIILFAGLPLAGLGVWALISAMRVPKIEQPIVRTNEPYRATYGNSLYSLSRELGLNPSIEGGNLDSRTNDRAMMLLNQHGGYLSDLLTSYKQDLLLDSEVEKMQVIARTEIEQNEAIPTDKIGDIDHAACIQSGLSREDCIYIRFMGDGIARMAEAHRTRDYKLLIDGERVYLTAWACLGKNSSRTPDFAQVKTVLQTFRTATHEALVLNEDFIGGVEETPNSATTTPNGLGDRIQNTLGE